MKKFLTISFILILASCEDPIVIDLPEGTNLLVIEGWVTDKIDRQSVIVTRTNGFSSLLANPPVSDAQVAVFDDEGGVFTYTYVDNGIYISDSSFSGTYGRSYQLRVILQNQDTVVSLSEQLIEVNDIDSLGFDFFLTQDETDPREEIIVYYPVAFSVDPADQVNFYKWNIFRNNVKFDDANSIVLLEDRFFNGNAFQNDFTDFEFDELDTIKIEIQSISLNVFEFFKLFQSQVVSLGTSSGSSPASLTGNIENISNPNEKVLGFFGATSLKSAETIIRP